MLFAAVLRAWVRDDDPGLARTMAELDRALGRGQRLVGLVDDLCRVPARLCRLRSRFRRRRDDEDECRGTRRGLILIQITDVGAGHGSIIALRKSALVGSSRFGSVKFRMPIKS